MFKCNVCHRVFDPAIIDHCPQCGNETDVLPMAGYKAVFSASPAVRHKEMIHIQGTSKQVTYLNTSIGLGNKIVLMFIVLITIILVIFVTEITKLLLIGYKPDSEVIIILYSLSLPILVLLIRIAYIIIRKTGYLKKYSHYLGINDYYISKCLLTQKEWCKLVQLNPSSFKGDSHPVESISWYDALVYCNRRSIQEKLVPVYSIIGSVNPIDWGDVPKKSNPPWDSVKVNWKANGYRLLTEKEWEYAANGGILAKTKQAFKYSGNNDINEAAWFRGNSNKKTHAVGEKAYNQLGIYDMSGNVWEWCWDWYAETKNHSTNEGPAIGTRRVIRGGSWSSSAIVCRVQNRHSCRPNLSSNKIGLRLCRSIL